MKLRTLEELRNGRFVDPEDSRFCKMAEISPVLGFIVYLACVTLLGKEYLWTFTIGALLFVIVVPCFLGYLVLCDCYIGEADESNF